MSTHSFIKVHTCFLFVISLMIFTSTSYAQSKNTSTKKANQKSKQIGFTTSQGFRMQVNGYLQSRYQSIENDEQYTWVGRHDGFGLSNARVIFQAQRKRLGTYISIEGARDRREPDNRAQGRVRMMMLDAYMSYEAHEAFQIFLGQFKPAYDANELESTNELMFADRALESRGVLGVEGMNVAGLSLRRHIGMQFNGRIAFDSKEKFILKYYLTLSNGNTSEEPLNDNDSLAYTGRVLLKLKASPKVQVHLGAGAYYNEITEGELPNLISEERVGYTADAKLNLYALKLRAQWMEQTRTAIDVPQEPDQIANGYHIVAGLNLGEFANALQGIIPAYRYAFYDPTADVKSDDPTLNQTLAVDALIHHTVGLNILLKRTNLNSPLKIQLNYTWAEEESARRTNNNRFDALVQLNF